MALPEVEVVQKPGTEGRRNSRPTAGSTGRTTERPLRSAVAAAAERATQATNRVVSGIVPRRLPGINDLLTHELSPADRQTLDEAAIKEGLFVDLDEKPAPPSAEDLAKQRKNQTRTRVIAALEGTAVLAAVAAGAGTAVAMHNADHVDHSLQGIDPHHGDLHGIDINHLDYDSVMVYAGDLQGHELPPTLQHQIEAAITPVQIDINPSINAPLAHHEITGIVVQGADGNPYIVTINPIQGEYNYSVDGKPVTPDYQGGLAVIPGDGGDASHMLTFAGGGTPSSDVLHIVTLVDGKAVITDALTGTDAAGNPILFVPPHEDPATGQLTPSDLFFPATNGAFVVDDAGHLVGLFGKPDRAYYPVTGTDPSDPALVSALTGTLYEIPSIRPVSSDDN